MEAVAALQEVLTVQRALQVVALVISYTYLFPKQAVVHDYKKYDFIVVGAGSAGTVVAHRLAECNFKVLLIEAGGDPTISSMVPATFPYTQQTELDWNHTNIHIKDKYQCHRGRTLGLSTGHVLGGGSSINTMFYVRGCPGDFSKWAKEAKDSSWNYDGMLPYFIKSERIEDKKILNSHYRRYHGTNGFLGVTRYTNPKTRPYFEAFEQLGNPILMDINGDESLGFTDQMYSIAGGVRQSTAYSLLAQYKNPNLEVLKHTLVTNILFDDTNNAVGVKALSDENKELLIQAKFEVILSAGAFGSPKLLITSGIGPEMQLKSLRIPIRKILPVGENLSDHASVLLSIKMDKSSEMPPPINPYTFPLSTITGYVALNQTQKCPTYQAITYLIPANSKAPGQQCVFNFRLNFDICHNMIEGGKDTNTLLLLLSLLHPKSRGRLTLRSTDPRDPPLINVGHLEENEDVETLVDSLLNYLRVLETPFFKSLNAEVVDLKVQMCEDHEYMSRDWWRCYVKCMISTIYHYIGTCSLGSVVDNKLRVFGIGRLRVIDGSVMPHLVGANTNAAIIAIGEKGADIIKNDYFCLN